MKTKTDHPDAVFGPDGPTNGMDVAALAKQVKGMSIRALTRDQLDDVVTILEFMQEHVVDAHEQNVARAQELDAREQALVQRERDVQLRGRAIDVAMRATNQAPYQVSRPGLRRYFGG